MRKITTICSSLLILVLSSVNSMALPQLNLSMPSFSGFGVGVSGTAGAWFASGQETEGTNLTGSTGLELSRDSDALAVGHSSVFLEYSIERLNGLTIGIDYVPETLSTSSTSRTDSSVAESGAVTSTTNKVQVDFNDLITMYVEVPILSTGFYIKGAVKQVDVKTNEVLNTGSSYADAELDGETIGLGFKHKFDNSVFLKADMTYTDFGSLSITSTGTESHNKVTASLEGVQATLSLGKSF